MNEVANVKRDIPAECEAFREMAAGWKNSICTRIVGLGDSLEQTLWCLLANGHILLEGVPGLVKHCWYKLFRNPPGCAPCAFSARQT
jgi:MoxR-like ATPase